MYSLAYDIHHYCGLRLQHDTHCDLLYVPQCIYEVKLGIKVVFYYRKP